MALPRGDEVPMEYGKVSALHQGLGEEDLPRMEDRDQVPDVRPHGLVGNQDKMALDESALRRQSALLSGRGLEHFRHSMPVL